MSKKQSHRGKHPEDSKLFGEKWISVLRSAVMDLSFLRSRNYSDKAALKIVGDHYQLTLRQRRAVLGASCSDGALEYRRSHEVSAGQVKGANLSIDGYNLLITVETALSGGILLRGRDACVRDLASLHGSYRKVSETIDAIRLMGRALEKLDPAGVTWYFDAPVSNSGKLKRLFCDEAGLAGWNWGAELSQHTDKTLADSHDIVVSSDGWILDRAERSLKVTDHIIGFMEEMPFVIDLGVED